jgi:Fe-S oxidoreductase
VDWKRIHAMFYMAVNFNLHLLRRALNYISPREDQIEKFRNNFLADNIVALSPEDRSRLPDYERCINCANCMAWCPVTNAIGSSRFEGPREISVAFSRGIPDFYAVKDQIYLCTLCRRCETYCSNNVPVAEIVRYVRAKLAQVDIQYVPKALIQVKDNIIRTGLPEGEFPARLLEYEKPEAEYVIFAGCRGLADSYSSVDSLLKLLDRIHVNFTTIKEQCCGGILLETGLAQDYEGYAQNIEAVLSKGTNKVITLCPLCHRTLATHPAYRGKFELVHYTELLSGIDFELKADDRAVTYHDPCLLVRDLGIVAEPRLLLKRAAGDLREMKESGHATFCCGAGGGLKEVDSDAAGRLARKRIEQAIDVGANVIVTACYECAGHLKKNANGEVEIFDLPDYLIERSK